METGWEPLGLWEEVWQVAEDRVLAKEMGVGGGGVVMEGGGNWLPVCPGDPWAPSYSDWRGSAQSFVLEERPWHVRQVQQKGASLQTWACPGGSVAGTCTITNYKNS